MEEKLRLSPGDTLRHDQHEEKGYMGQIDVDYYSVIDKNGSIVGSVIYTQDMAIKGFKVTHSLIQKGISGEIILETTWQ